MECHLDSKHALLKDKCRIKWLQQGDRNSKNFYTTLARHRPLAGIHSLMINGTLVSDADIMQNHIVEYFSNLFSAPNIQRDYSFVNQIIPLFVSPNDNNLLLRVHMDLEIKEVVFSMDANSSPG